MKNHGLILGVFQATHILIRDPCWVSVKRAAGAYKIAHFMRQQGWDVEVIDYWLSFDYEEWKELIDSRVTPDTKWIGLSLTFPITGRNNTRSKKYLQYIKDNYPHVTIVCGSKAIYTGIYLHEYIDYYLFGYGEYGFNELCKKLLGKPSAVVIEEYPVGEKQGVAEGVIRYVDCDKHHICAPQKDLTVEYEDRDFILPNEHMTFEFARGCKFKCKFCSYNMIGVKGDYTRDMNNWYTEAMRNYDKWGLTNYSVADETFNDSIPKLQSIVEQTRKMPFKLDMAGYVRADLIASRPQDRELMAEMGFWGHYYGIETLNHESGKTIGKGINPDKLKTELKAIKKYFETHNQGRYRATASWIVGLPFETPETYWDGISWWAKEMPLQHMAAFPLFISNASEEERRVFKGAESEFDRTWRQSNLFGTYEEDEEVGVDPNQLPDFCREYVMMRYRSSVGAKWTHEHFNHWTAHVEWGKTLMSDQFLNSGIGAWWFHHYHTTGMGTYEELLKLRERDIHIPEVMRRTEEHIENYKWKKLSL